MAGRVHRPSGRSTRPWVLAERRRRAVSGDCAARAARDTRPGDRSGSPAKRAAQPRTGRPAAPAASVGARRASAAAGRRRAPTPARDRARQTERQRRFAGGEHVPGTVALPRAADRGREWRPGGSGNEPQVLDATAAKTLRQLRSALLTQPGRRDDIALELVELECLAGRGCCLIGATRQAHHLGAIDQHVGVP